MRSARLKCSEAERLGEEIAELRVYLHVAKAHLLDLIREFDEKHCWEGLGFPSCVSWLGFQCGIGANAAREYLRMAHAGSEKFLLMVAKHGTASHVERLVSQYRRVEKLNRRPLPGRDSSAWEAACRRRMHREWPHVSAETSHARLYAGEEMDMEYAVWVMANAGPPG